jgi:ABC-type sugar transport system permease subunit
MVVPTTVIVIAVVVVPLLWNVLLSFQDADFVSISRKGLFQPLTLSNFVKVLTDPGFWGSLWTTLVYSVCSTAGSVLVGLIAALSFRRPFRGRGMFRAFMLLPYVAPVVAVTFVWEIMLSPQFGILNEFGTRFLGWGEPVDFLTRSPYALMTVITFEIWRYFPFAFLFLTARLLALPKELEEAAVVDGATPLQTFRHVVMPQLAGVVALLSVLRLIMTFNKFDDVFLLTGGTAGTEVASVRVFHALVGDFDIGGAAANSLILSAILAVSLFVYMRFFAVKEKEA